MSPFFITTDDDIELLLDSRNEKLCKNPLNTTLVRKWVIVNDDIVEDSDEESDDDGGDLYSHDGGSEMHNTFFDVDILETDQIEVDTSRTKLSMYHNVEPVGVQVTQ